MPRNDGRDSLGAVPIDAGVPPQLSFFFKYFTVSVAHSCRNIPVNKPYVISGLIFSHFFKSHTTTFKCCVIFSRK